MRGLGRFSSYLFLATIAASCSAATANPPNAETPSNAGQSTPTATTRQPSVTPISTASGPSPTPSPTPRPTLGVTVTRATYGSVSAQTAPGATCTASARLPSGRDSTAAGLDTHSADASGSISWTYRTVSNTGAGTGMYTVSCSSGAQNKTVTAPFTVQ